MFDYGTDVGIVVNHIGDPTSLNRSNHLSDLMSGAFEDDREDDRIGYAYIGDSTSDPV